MAGEIGHGRDVATKVTEDLRQLTEAFLLHKRVSGCSEHTLEIFELWLTRLRDIPSLDEVSFNKFVNDWKKKGLKQSTLERGVRALRVFFKWSASSGKLADPTRNLKIKIPKTLPTVPGDKEIQQLLKACPKDSLGVRNKALILVMADAGLRASEVLRLLVAHWNPADRSLFVRGKGGKDRTTFVGLPTSRTIKDYLATRQLRGPEDFLFVNEDGAPINRRHLIQILHRISKKAGLKDTRRIHPHALRHYAATSWLRAGVGLDQVRRLLGHESLATTLTYSSLVSVDLQQAHRRAATIERIMTFSHGKIELYQD